MFGSDLNRRISEVIKHINVFHKFHEVSAQFHKQSRNLVKVVKSFQLRNRNLTQYRERVYLLKFFVFYLKTNDICKI